MCSGSAPARPIFPPRAKGTPKHSELRARAARARRGLSEVVRVQTFFQNDGPGASARVSASNSGCRHSDPTTTQHANELSLSLSLSPSCADVSTLVLLAR